MVNSVERGKAEGGGDGNGKVGIPFLHYMKAEISSAFFYDTRAETRKEHIESGICDKSVFKRGVGAGKQIEVKMFDQQDENHIENGAAGKRYKLKGQFSAEKKEDGEGTENAQQSRSHQRNNIRLPYNDSAANAGHERIPPTTSSKKT